jgi:hypothetical protein
MEEERFTGAEAGELPGLAGGLPRREEGVEALKLRFRFRKGLGGLRARTVGAKQEERPHRVAAMFAENLLYFLVF